MYGKAPAVGMRTLEANYMVQRANSKMTQQIRDTSDFIKIAFMSDIHVETQYVQVYKIITILKGQAVQFFHFISQKSCRL